MFGQFVRIFRRRFGWQGVLVLVFYGLCFVVIVGWIVRDTLAQPGWSKLWVLIPGVLVVGGMILGANFMARDVIRRDSLLGRAPHAPKPRQPPRSSAQVSRGGQPATVEKRGSPAEPVAWIAEADSLVAGARSLSEIDEALAVLRSRFEAAHLGFLASLFQDLAREIEGAGPSDLADAKESVRRGLKMVRDAGARSRESE